MENPYKRALIYGIFGHPILQSISPELFCTYFKKYRIEAKYLRIDAVKPGEIIYFAREFMMKGFNITSPLKIRIIPFLDKMEHTASKIQAVNLVRVEKGRFKGYNTDYTGVLRAMEGIKLKDRHILVLGSGGAGRAVGYALWSAGARDVKFLCRDREKIAEYCRKLGFRVYGFDELEYRLKETDFAVNCLPAGINLIKEENLRKDMIIFDANYCMSELSASAIRKGCRVISGYDWLFYQFEEGFELLTGRKIREERHEFDKGRQESAKPLAMIGFMGTGKTAAAGIIAERLGLEPVDTDREIEKISGMQIEDIFESMGDEGFRDMEKRVLSGLEFKPGRVYSFGGGAVQSIKNIDKIRTCCRVVLLWSDIETVIARIKKSPRPLAEGDNIEQSLKELLSKRLERYIDTADFIILNEGDLSGIAERIIKNAY